MPRALRLVHIAAALGVAACGSQSAQPPLGGDPNSDTWCPQALEVLTTPGTPPANPPARLGDRALGTGFLADVFADVALTGIYGRRVTFADVNGDDYPDFIAVKTGVVRGQQQLLINLAGKHFVENTTASGITTNRSGGNGQVALMVAFADVDNDGDHDLFSGSYSQDPAGANYVADPNEIYLNDGSGHFTLLLGSGIHQPWPLTTAAATFVDYDKDGILDLFVGNFMIDYPTYTSYADNLYRGRGDGTFELRNTAAGIVQNGAVGAADGRFNKPTYGVTACDVDNDGWSDLLVATYALSHDELWRNLGDGTFANIAQSVAFHMDTQDNPAEGDWRDGGNTFAHACGDYDNDGDLDVMTAETMHGDYPRSTADRSRILRNTGAAGGYAFERPALADTGIDRVVNGTGGEDAEWGNEGDHGVAWLDLDNDGLLDLVIEASAYPNSHAWLYHQLPDHTFENVTPESGVAASMVNSNGLSVDDYDRDGDLDILMGSVNTGSQQAPGGVEQVHLYENRAGQYQSFIYITLRGTSANRHGIGARVYVEAGGLRQMREVSGGKGTFGAADPAYAHFGLGDVALIDRLEIHWPTDPVEVQAFGNVAVNQFLEIAQGSSDARTWCAD